MNTKRLVLLLGLGGAGFWWWRSRQAVASSTAGSAGAAPPVAASAAASSAVASGFPATSAPAVAPSAAAPAPAVAAAQLIPKGVLFDQGYEFWSPGKKHYVVFQPDGNLVVYTPDKKPIWATGTQNKGGSDCIFQEDGNLCVYAGDRYLWGSGTQGKAVNMRLLDSGQFQALDASGAVVWTTPAAPIAQPAAKQAAPAAKPATASSAVVAKPVVLAGKGSVTVVQPVAKKDPFASPPIVNPKGQTVAAKSVVVRGKGSAAVYQ